MEKWIEILTKYLPAPVIVGIIAIVLGFIATFYLKRYRVYGDVLHDRWFLNATVLIVALVAFYIINAGPKRVLTGRPLLIIPLFQNDEGNLYRTALTAQIESELDPGSRVEFYDSFIADVETAENIARNHNAAAIIYKASVIDKDNSLVSCFSLLVPATGLNKSCPMVPLKLPKESLSDIVGMIANANGGDARSEIDRTAIHQPTELLSKIEALERQLAEVRSNSAHKSGVEPTFSNGTSTRPSKSNSTVATAQPTLYKKKYALVIGINNYSSAQNLTYAASDAQQVSSALTSYNFDVRLLLNASRADIVKGISDVKADVDDLVLIYFTGMTAAFPDSGKEQLYLLPSDFDLENTSSGLSILEIKKQIESLKAFQKLVIIDGCHGTTGLSESVASSPSSDKGDQKEPAFFFFVGTQDNQYSMESRELNGGAFTQILLRTLHSAFQTETTQLPIQELFSMTETRMNQAKLKQNPKLVRVSGTGQLILSKS